MEIFWIYCCYEFVIECGIKFYVYGNFDYGYKFGGYDVRFWCGYYDGKGWMGEWILSQNVFDKKRMKVVLFMIGLYIEMVFVLFIFMVLRVEVGEVLGEQVVIWRVLLGEKGGVLYVLLDDCVYYVRWLFDNFERVDGMNLVVVVDYIYYLEVVSVFEKVIGCKVKYVDVDFEMYFLIGYWGMIVLLFIGYMVDSKSLVFMSFKDNFIGFWRLWQGFGLNQGVVKRDYVLLDEIYLNRIKSVEEFFRRENEKVKVDGWGLLWEVVDNVRFIFKIYEDGSL